MMSVFNFSSGGAAEGLRGGQGQRPQVGVGGWECRSICLGLLHFLHGLLFSPGAARARGSHLRGWFGKMPSPTSPTIQAALEVLEFHLWSRGAPAHRPYLGLPAAPPA